MKKRIEIEELNEILEECKERKILHKMEWYLLVIVVAGTVKSYVIDKDEKSNIIEKLTENKDRIYFWHRCSLEYEKSYVSIKRDSIDFFEMKALDFQYMYEVTPAEWDRKDMWETDFSID